MKKFLNTDIAVGYTYFHATSCGALLAAKNDLNNEAKYFIKLWGEGYLKYWNNYMLAYLMRDRKTAKFLSHGTLTSVFSLTKEGCNQETKEIIDVLSKSMMNRVVNSNLMNC
ncbi:hypothetical protein A3860_39790 [Niastella vici]|uniref:Uncharacterized protein n=1 Tax=Niastella vici TaxID=1703345 RepID=A0A1V9FHW2_9BACT|nr:hypothetical protein [Niastella vici]OQP57920.1 hypothetical protein A3860_39790 [Niastella vici]